MGNPVVHVELIGPDPEALRAFSDALFIEPADGSGPAAGGIGGGSVVLPLQVNEGTGVRVGHFRDPAGNLVGVAGPA